MKLSSAVVLAAATASYASLSDVQGVLSSVGSGIEALDSAANSFNGDVDAVKSKADALVSAIKAGKSKIDGSGDLTLNDALGLTSPVQALTKKGQTLADDFKAKRSEVEKAGACDTVRTELKDINDNSQALIKAVVSKVPKDAQTIAESLAGGLTKVLNQAQDDFSESNCKNSGGSGGSGGSATKTGGASQTSAAASHSSAAATGGEPSAPETTLSPTTTAYTGGSGNSTATGNPPPVTAGASFLAPAGALVMAVAAALL